MTNDTQIYLRLPKKLLTRIEKLCKNYKNDPKYSGFSITRQTVIRLAINKGLEELEKEAEEE